MPYSTSQGTRFSPSDALPQHLAHKPVYALPYEDFDGIYIGEGTDVRYITVGLAQYDHDRISLKTFRHTGQKWSRQSEELPIHRVIDAAIFLTKVLFDRQGHQVSFPSGTFEGQDQDIVLYREQRSSGELDDFEQFINNNAPLNKKRFNKLLEVLNQLKIDGKI